jgi:hypothetical protein
MDAKKTNPSPPKKVLTGPKGRIFILVWTNGKPENCVRFQIRIFDFLFPRNAPRGLAMRAPRSCISLVLRHQLDATILRAAFWGVVRRNEIGLAVPVRDQPARRDSLLHQIFDDRIRTPVG